MLPLDPTQPCPSPFQFYSNTAHGAAWRGLRRKILKFSSLTNKKNHRSIKLKMKKLIAITAAFSSYLLAVPSALAQTNVQACPTGQFSILCNFGLSSFGNIVSTTVTVLFVIAVVIALGFLIYGGIKWIISGGDKTAVESARNTIVAAVVGLIIVFLAFFILNIILGFFGISLTALQLPKLNPNALPQPTPTP